MRHHMDGIAIGAVVSELLDRGVLEDLKKTRSALNVNSLARSAGAKTGYFHVAMRLLAHQGFVRLRGDIPEGETNVALTDHGREWLTLAHYYRQVPVVTDLAASLLDVLHTGKGGELREWRLPDVPVLNDEVNLPGRVALHLYGWLVAVVMEELSTQGIFHKMGSGVTSSVALREQGCGPSVIKFVREIFQAQRWAEHGAENLVLTAAGRVAASLAIQYHYPVSYLPAFRTMPEDLFGTRNRIFADASGTDERHVDRLLDVRFSGRVFERSCKEPFLEMALPVFDREPLSEQPACIVDTGSGDGTLLVAFYEAVSERTLRGRMLRAYPLKLVGAEYTRIAREATEQALQALGVPHMVIFGDISYPSDLSRTLAEHGIDPLNVLHVNKSVIHNRTYKPPVNTHRRDVWQPVSNVPFVSPDGGLIPARDLECNLVELFEAWSPFTRKHGMVTIEAHTVDPAILSERVAENMLTVLDATHGFSCQYLVEYEVFLRASQVAGYHCQARRILAGWPPNHPILTVHHFVHRDRINPEINFNAPSES